MSSIRYRKILPIIAIIIAGVVLAGIFCIYYIYDFTSHLNIVGSCSYKKTEYIQLSREYDFEAIRQISLSKGIPIEKNYFNSLIIPLQGKYDGEITLVGPNALKDSWTIQIYIYGCTNPSGQIVKEVKEVLGALEIETERVKASEFKQQHTMSMY